MAPGMRSTWMVMIRSLTHHTYNPAFAEGLTHLIVTQYSKELQSLQQELLSRAEEIG